MININTLNYFTNILHLPDNGNINTKASITTDEWLLSFVFLLNREHDKTIHTDILRPVLYVGLHDLNADKSQWVLIGFNQNCKSFVINLWKDRHRDICNSNDDDNPTSTEWDSQVGKCIFVIQAYFSTWMSNLCVIQKTTYLKYHNWNHSVFYWQP